MIQIVKIISGGQTGADRAGLDAAMESGIFYGGWCPKGRKAEDGRIPEKYKLVEMDRIRYACRTRENVINSHVTLIFTYGKPAGGSAETAVFARHFCRPYRHIDLDRKIDDKAMAKEILRGMHPGGLSDDTIPAVPPCPVVNTAGSRESKAPGIHDRVYSIVMEMLTMKDYIPGNE